MKIRTVEDLCDRIDADLAWRRTELSAFQGAVRAASRVVQTALLRGSVAMLYAHWEGFVKEAAYLYLCFLASQNLTTAQLRPEIAGLSLRAEIRMAVDSRSAQFQSNVVRLLREDGAKRANIPNKKDSVRTESNLSFRVLSDILSSIGIESSIYENRKDLIDAELVAVRNRIVHGENETIRLSEWIEVRNAVVQLMRNIADQIQNSASGKEYLASSFEVQKL